MDRVKFIVTTCVEYFSVSPSMDSGGNGGDTKSIAAVREFCENDDITILAATTKGQTISYQHKVPTDENCLLFYKIPQFGNITNLSKDQHQQPLGILTLEGGLVKSIYNSVSRVFLPHLTKNSEYSPEIEKIIDNLYSSLGSSLGLPQSEIRSIKDEIKFWQEKSTNSPTKSGKEKAKEFVGILENLNRQFCYVEYNSIKTLEEFLNSTNNILDELWRSSYNYPQNRMIDLMNIICSSIIEICSENLINDNDIWNLNSFHIVQTINEVYECCESWIQCCESLTKLFWPNNIQHQWIGEPNIPMQAIQFRERLNEIKNIKNMYKQIASIFMENNNQIVSQNIGKVFRPFRDVNIFDTSPFGNKMWKKAVYQFQIELQPIDEKIAKMLKSKLNSQINNPRQIVHIFSTYDSILRRPSIMTLLNVEREQFLQSIHLLIKDLKDCLNQTHSYQSIEQMSPVCWECRWLKVVEHQIGDILKVLHLVEDKDGFTDTKRTLENLRTDIENLLKTNFDLWRNESLASVKNGDLVLKDDKPVVEFEKDGRQLMQVTFKPKLVTFCYDIRELETLGFRVPIELRDIAAHAMKFMAYARRLQQIATFHNTIGDRMIPCQRPIMLSNAIELSRLVQSESVKWNDEDSVNRYVSTLQVAVSKLSRDNTFLVGQHEQFKKSILKLINTDLLRQGQSWKDELRHLRDLIGTLESKGYTNLQAFKLHWDYQLYKVLEYQYIAGLYDLSHKLPDISIDIVFRQQQLQFRPPMEEIRLKYYSQLRRFLERPLGFRGISDNSNNLFKTMVDRNRHRFLDLYKRADDLFDQLLKLKDAWIPWIALGCVNLDELCDVHLSKWKDWDINFKACKHFSQLVAKIQDSEERLDCFVINLVPLKSDIEFISRKYWETLANSLRTSILNDVSVLQDFLNSSLQVLQNVPLDEAGIAEAGAKYERIRTELPKMSDLLQIVEEKDTCLAGWCKERVMALSNILTQWEQLNPLIENHSVILQRQIEIMRDHVKAQMDNLEEEAQKFLIRWESTIENLESNENCDLTLFRERQQNWLTIKDKKDNIKMDCEKFNIEFVHDLNDLFEKIDQSVKTQGEQWEQFEEFTREFEEISAEEWAVFRRRPYIVTNFISKWNSNGKLSNNSSSTRIRKILDGYQSVMPVLQNLQADGLTDQHWAKIFFMLKQKPKSYHDICIKDVLQNTGALFQNSTEIQNLVRQAASEQIIRQAISELEQWGVTAVLRTTLHNDSKGEVVTIITDFQDVLNKIGDNQCLLQSAKNSSAIEAFLDQAEIWETRLASLDNILSGLNQIQRRWIYLEPIFGTGTLKNEENTFRRIDKDFRYIMREISNDCRVMSIMKINNISTIIHSLENQLSRCQKTLTAFISGKRNAFPRFYFLSDDDLLEILGQSSKVDVVQKHIKKLFPGIHHLKLTHKDQLLFISGICSAEGDQILLKNLIQITGPVEEWLNQLVVEIKFTLKDLIRQCSQNDQFDDHHIQMYPVQVLTCAKAISFTRITEKSISTMSLQTLLKKFKEEINIYSEKKIKSDDPLFRSKLGSILVDLVHHVSIIESLIQNNVTNTQDWLWLQQLKFYIGQDDRVIIKMVFAEFEYSYEYLGNPNKLVHTALTHKCYLTLTQSMQLGLGGNPYGPAGTGKTECVKALGGMLGRLVLVFNCNENLDTASMGLILSGLARCGAWGCFDEFNRLQEDTLSAISMLIQPLQDAIKEKQETVTLFEEAIPLNLHCGIFVTLNPAGEGYGGRQSLPGNLQALFRPIVMQHPDPIDIARVMLFVEGFKNSNKISARLVELFKMASKMLSPQRHYEWGLRELKTILLACGKALQEVENIPSEDEEMILTVRALRSNTMSKLNAADCKLFDMLISDIFPDTRTETTGQYNIEKSIEDAFSSLGLQSDKTQTKKCLQLYEQLQKRMGVVVLGPPSSGKTTIINVLKQALTSSVKTIRTYTIAPKSMDRVQLLGKLDPDTRQWNDGVLTTTAVAVNSEPQDVISWIICDGDVDPEWIEALNSVLDDNKLLTLPSGWRIQFGNNVNFIFETHDLRNASPATISRMGIINLSEEDLADSTIIDLWLTKQEDSNLIHSSVDQYFQNAIDWARNAINRHLPTSRINTIKSGLYFLDKVTGKDEFAIQIIRGLGSLLNGDELSKFSSKVLESMDIFTPNRAQPELSYYNSFRDTIESFESDTGITNDTETFSSGLVKTAQMKMYSDVLRYFLKKDNSPFLLIGSPGCGKTLLLKNIVTEFSGYQLIIINCSAQLSANFILYLLKENCLVISGIKGREYKPKMSKIILYFKNINLCNRDKWGSTEVIELLQQLIHRNGFYATDTLEWIGVSGIQICGSISDLSKCYLSPRFLSIVKYLNFKNPTQLDMQLILKSQLQPIYDQFKISKVKIEAIVDALIHIFSNIFESFKPELKNHYSFSPKMITEAIIGLEFYPKDHLQQAISNELKNIFRNRLASNDHLEKFDDIIRSNMQQAFPLDNSKTYFIPNGVKTAEMRIISLEELTETIKRNITICNNEDILLELPITDEILDLTASICRTLSRPQTNMILCGSIGIGHKESLHIGCTILNMKIFSPIPIINYKLEDFQNDLKMAMQIAAIEDQSVVLHIDQAWINLLPDIMRPIEAVLQGCELPEIFGDDLETIAGSLRHAAQTDGYQDSISSYFWKKVRDNLHIVISFEPSSTNLEDLFNQYPSLFWNAEMIFTNDLHKSTIETLPKQMIKTLNSAQSIEVPLLDFYPLITGQWSLSPRRYMQLLRTYFTIYEHFREKLEKQRNKLKIGVDKLSSTHTIVDTLRTEAKEQEIALAEKRKLANQALEMISSTMRNANDQRSDLLELKQKTQNGSDKLLERKKAIELELKEVEPILRDASAAVGQIKSEALSEIRSLRAPPDIIRDILDGVLRLMGIRDTSWNSMKSFLAKRGVKEDIRLLDPARISQENCQAVEKLLKSKSESFLEKNAKRASVAAAPLAAWVMANVKYAKVIQSIKPLEMEQQALQKNLEKSEDEMKSLISGLDDVDAKVAELSGQLNIYTQEAAVIEIKLDQARNTLKAAEVLVDKLSNEYSSWSSQLEELNENLSKLDVKSFLISISLSHLSDCTYEDRKRQMQSILSHFDMEEYSLCNSIITDQDKIVWESIGLTGDVQSMENAAILSKIVELPFGTTPIPLLLDPSGSVFIWLQEYLKLNSISYDITSQSAERFTYTLELAVRFGKCLIIQDCQTIRTPLLGIIFATIYSRFNKKSLQVGNKLIDFNENFRLILITKMSKIHIGNEIGAYVTQIPFTTTIEGYTDQLMAKTIQLKQPELEIKRKKLLQDEGQLWKQQMELQDKLLEELSTAQGDILKNEALLKTLNEVKESSSSIKKSIEESSKVRSEIMIEYNQFRNICESAAKLFIGISKIYDISVAAFTSLYIKSVRSSEEFDQKMVYRYLVRLTYSNLSKAISKSNYVMLGLDICRNAYPEQINKKEWESFITNFMTGEDTSQQTIPTWIKKELKPKVTSFKANHITLYESLKLDDESLWDPFVNDQSIHEPPVNISEFGKILITQIFRPDLLSATITKVIKKLLGNNTMIVTKPTIQQLAEESHKDQPILLVTTGDIDPSKEIQEYAQNHIGKSKYFEIAIGKGQEQNALLALRKAAENGNWICLKNIHLVPDWLIVLNQELNHLEANENFRLWLLCESTQSLPQSLTLKCNKVLYESPNGVRNKVLRLIQFWNHMLSQKRDPKSLKLYIVVFILNAIIQERRDYIPQGWSKWYDFADSDLRTAISIIGWIEKSIGFKIDWPVLKGLCLNIAYGGRINNPQDIILLETHLDEFFDNKILGYFWNPLNFKMSLPQSNKISDYQNAIGQLPDAELPENYGLSASTNVSKNLIFCRNLLKQMRSNYFSSVEHENFEKRIRPILNLWKKLTSGTSILETFSTMKHNDKSDNPWNCFIVSELRLAGNLFQIIHKTLVNLHVAAKNMKSIHMDDHQLMITICENQVPLIWREIWSGPKLTTDYIKAVVIRAVEAERRYISSNNIMFGDQIDFANIFSIESFLAALKLTNARELGKSTSELMLSSSLTGKLSTSNLTTPKVMSLQIDGAMFKNNKLQLADQLIHSQSSAIIPEFELNFVIQADNVDRDMIELPIYTNSTREHFICKLKLCTTNRKEMVILAGAAIIIPDIAAD